MVDPTTEPNTESSASAQARWRLAAPLDLPAAVQRETARRKFKHSNGIAAAAAVTAKAVAPSSEAASLSIAGRYVFLSVDRAIRAFLAKMSVGFGLGMPSSHSFAEAASKALTALGPNPIRGSRGLEEMFGLPEYSAAISQRASRSHWLQWTCNAVRRPRQLLWSRSGIDVDQCPRTERRQINQIHVRPAPLCEGTPLQETSP